MDKKIVVILSFALIIMSGATLTATGYCVKYALKIAELQQIIDRRPEFREVAGVGMVYSVPVPAYEAIVQMECK